MKDAGELDPLIQGLLSWPPKSGGVWPSANRELWLDLLEGSFRLIYKDAPDGKVRRPEKWPALPTWQPAPRLPHSVKPSVFHSWLEQACPEGPWLELFARRTRLGWSSWGNEVPHKTQTYVANGEVGACLSTRRCI